MVSLLFRIILPLITNMLFMFALFITESMLLYFRSPSCRQLCCSCRYIYYIHRCIVFEGGSLMVLLSFVGLCGAHCKWMGGLYVLSQPRVLDAKQLMNVSSKLKQWGDAVQQTVTFMESNTVELFA